MGALLVSVMYPGGTDPTFDHEYYLRRHIPLVRELWSAHAASASRCFGEPGSPTASPHLVR